MDLDTAREATREAFEEAGIPVEIDYITDEYLEALQDVPEQDVEPESPTRIYRAYAGAVFMGGPGTDVRGRQADLAGSGWCSPTGYQIGRRWRTRVIIGRCNVGGATIWKVLSDA